MFRPKKAYNVKKSNPYSNYKKDRTLGKGGYATVSLYRKGQKQFIAIKEFSKAQTDSKPEFYLEINGYRGAGEHKHLVKFMDAFETELAYCIVLEYCAQGTLKGIYKKYDKYTEREVRDVVVQCCSALEHLLERRVVHRDIKPDNILVKRWFPIHVCLADLNFSRKVKSAEHSTVMATNLGTKGYMAPEIDEKALRNDKRKYNFTVDVFALGVVTYELLSGEHKNRPSFLIPQKEVDAAMSNFTGTHRDQAALLKKMRIQHLEKMDENGVVLHPPERWETISEEAKELVSKMISPLYTSRPSYEAILSSDWAVKEYPHKVPGIIRSKVLS